MRRTGTLARVDVVEVVVAYDVVRAPCAHGVDVVDALGLEKVEHIVLLDGDAVATPQEDAEVVHPGDGVPGDEDVAPAARALLAADGVPDAATPDEVVDDLEAGAAELDGVVRVPERATDDGEAVDDGVRAGDDDVLEADHSVGPHRHGLVDRERRCGVVARLDADDRTGTGVLDGRLRVRRGGHRAVAGLRVALPDRSVADGRGRAVRRPVDGAVVAVGRQGCRSRGGAGGR